MPFTVNVGPYVGGQLWARGFDNLGQGIQTAGSGIAKAIEESKKAEEDQAADQIILNYAKQQGMVTPDIEAQYLKGSHSTKNGVIVGLTRQFAMTQQQKEQEAIERHRQAQENQAAAELALRQGEANWTPPPEAVAAAKEQGATYLPTGLGKYQIKLPASGEEAETIDFKDSSGTTHKVSIRSALGQKILERENPEKALEWNTSLTKDDLFDSSLHEAGTADAAGNFTPLKPDYHGNYDLNKATHMRIGGQVVMPKQQFLYYQKRLKPKTQEETKTETTVAEKGSGGPSVGDKRTINGVLAEWDGKGWKPVK